MAPAIVAEFARIPVWRCDFRKSGDFRYGRRLRLRLPEHVHQLVHGPQIVEPALGLK